MTFRSLGHWVTIAGSIIYIAAMNHFPLSEVLAFAVVLHSIPGERIGFTAAFFLSTLYGADYWPL